MGGDRSGRPLLERADCHQGSVFCAAWSVSGSLLATGSNDHTVRLLRLRRGGGAAALLKEASGEVLRGHDGTVRDIGFSPVADMIASAGCGHSDCGAPALRGVSGGALTSALASSTAAAATAACACGTALEGSNSPPSRATPTQSCPSALCAPAASAAPSSGFPAPPLAHSDCVLWLRALARVLPRKSLQMSLIFIPTAQGADGRTLTTADAGGFVRVWDPRARGCVHSIAACSGHAAALTSMALGPVRNQRTHRKTATACAGGDSRSQREVRC